MQNGPSSAAEILLQRLERRQDWLRELIKALLNPDIGLVDFGEKIEKKYGELIFKRGYLSTNMHLIIPYCFKQSRVVCIGR